MCIYVIFRLSMPDNLKFTTWNVPRVEFRIVKPQESTEWEKFLIKHFGTFSVLILIRSNYGQRKSFVPPEVYCRITQLSF